MGCASFSFASPTPTTFPSFSFLPPHAVSDPSSRTLLASPPRTSLPIRGSARGQPGSATSHGGGGRQRDRRGHGAGAATAAPAICAAVWLSSPRPLAIAVSRPISFATCCRPPVPSSSSSSSRSAAPGGQSPASSADRIWYVRRLSLFIQFSSSDPLSACICAGFVSLYTHGFFVSLLVLTAPISPTEKQQTKIPDACCYFICLIFDFITRCYYKT
jgi:hypothetical protein